MRFREFMDTLHMTEDFEVNLEGKIDFSKKDWLAPIAKILKDARVNGIKVTVLNQEEYQGDPEDEWMREYENPIVDLSLVQSENHHEISIRAEDDAKEARSKKKQNEIIQFRLQVFNAFLDGLGVEVTAQIGESDGSEYSWKEGTPGVVVTSKNNKDKKNYNVYNTAPGCNYLCYYFEENPDRYLDVFKKLIQCDFFAKRMGEIALDADAGNVVELLDSMSIPVSEILSPYSVEIKGNETLLGTMKYAEN